jgi:branched-chain amino acid transport system substrate-binding protein
MIRCSFSRWHYFVATVIVVVVAVASSVIMVSGQETPAAADQSRHTSKRPIKIGFIASTSGIGSTGGQDEINGIKLYLEQIHYTMAGRKVELIVENDESNPSRALEKMFKLVNQDKVDIVDGITFSHVAYALARAEDKFQVPLVIAVPGADDLTQRKRSGWVVRTSFSSSQSALPFGEWVCKHLKYRRVCTMGVNFPYSWESVGGFQTSFEAMGGKVVQKIWVPLGFTDVGFINQIHKDVDAVYLVTIGTVAARVPKQLRQVFPKLPIISGAASFDESALQTMGDEALGAITAVVYSASLDTPDNKRFVAAYRAKYGMGPNQFAEGAYTSGMAIRQAVETVKGDVEEKAKLMAALRKVEIKDAPRGPVKMDAYGNPIENIYVCRVDKVNGKLQQTVIDTVHDVSQFWKKSPDDYLKQSSFSAEYPPCRYCTTSQ